MVLKCHHHTNHVIPVITCTFYRWKDYAVKKLFFSFPGAKKQGYIDRKDVLQLLCALGVDVPDCSIPALLSLLDSDGDGRLSYPEYDQWWDGIESHRIFCSYDKDKSGDIDKKELKNIAKDLGILVLDEDLESAFNMLDTKGTKHITFEEFLPWWMLVTNPNKTNETHRKKLVIGARVTPCFSHQKSSMSEPRTRKSQSALWNGVI
jgi:Ca2+-binding EF-hand superfamily protein